jgi:hypothetical protein
MGPGIEGYHVLGERTRTYIERGDELWMYWTTGLMHWANWGRTSHGKYEKIIAVKIDGTWYFIDQADVQGRDHSSDQMKRFLAMKLKVLPEELVVTPSTEPVLQLIQREIDPVSVWKVEFKAPEWDELVDITIQYEGQSYPTTIRKRQTLDQLEISLRSFPKSDEWVSWYRPGGYRINNSISLYEWHTNDILEIRRDAGQEIHLQAKFRHTMMLRTDAREWLIERESKNWVASTQGLNPRLLTTITREEEPFCPKVEVYEKFRSREEYDNAPEVYVWLQLEGRRLRQYRGQYVYDIIHQLARDDGCEQTGSLRWGTKLLRQDDTLPPEGQLSMFSPSWARAIAGIEIFTSESHWRAEESIATRWHNGLWPVQGRNQDCRVRLHAITPPGVDLTSPLPRKCSFVCLFICLFGDTYSRQVKTKISSGRVRAQLSTQSS